MDKKGIDLRAVMAIVITVLLGTIGLVMGIGVITERTDSNWGHILVLKEHKAAMLEAKKELEVRDEEMRVLIDENVKEISKLRSGLLCTVAHGNEENASAKIMECASRATTK